MSHLPKTPNYFLINWSCQVEALCAPELGVRNEIMKGDEML